MHVVGGGEVGDLAEGDRERCRRSAAWFRWDGQLWTVQGGERRIPPLAERLPIVKEAAQRLGYPHGATLAQLLGQWYYWHGLVSDCIRLCSAWLPV